MKKNLLTMALAAGVLLPVSAQWTQVGGTVKVKPNTLKYVKGDFTILDGTESNEGNIRVEGSFNNAKDTNHADLTSNFVNEYANGKSYGQLIINSTSAAQGQVQSDFKNTGEDVFYNQPTAIPFTDVTADEFATMSGIPTSGRQWQNHPGNGVFNRNRYKNPVFTSRIEGGKPGIDDRMSGDVMEPELNHQINQGFFNLAEREVTYQGNPANGTHTLSGTAYTITNNFDKNVYGEWALTYVVDFAEEMPAGFDQYVAGSPVPAGNYGSNIFSFGNPYTSNIDLRESLTSDGTITHVSQYTGNDFDPGTYYGQADYSSANKVIGLLVNPTTGTWGGATNAFIVRPFHVFKIKTTGDFSFDLNDANKTFESIADGADALSYTTRSFDIDDAALYQVEMKIKHPDTEAFSNTFVIANNAYQPSAQAGNEAYDPALSDDVNAIYTLQEAADGTVDESLRHNKTYINGINATDYVGLPVYVVQQVVSPNDFEFTFDLSDDLVNSDNKFFFEDRVTGTVETITKEYVYDFTASETSSDRFALYWNEYAKLGVDDAVELTSQTIVYKVANEFKVRFSKDWNTADIYVYNMLGQLVHSKKGVKTDVDYTLPLANASAAYVVKTVGDNGEVVTKKVIK